MNTTPGKAQAILLGQDEVTCRQLHHLLLGTKISKSVDLSVSTLIDGKCPPCDAAVAILSRDENYASFVTAVQRLKNVQHIPVVIALIDAKQKPKIKISPGDLCADDLIYFPIKARELAHIIETHIVSQRFPQESAQPIQADTSRDHKLESYLVEEKIITPSQLKEALEHQQTSGKYRLVETLTELGFIDESKRINLKAAQMGVHFATNKQILNVDLSVVQIIPEASARQHTCLAVARNSDTLTVAVTDPLNLQLLDFLRDHVNLNIKPMLATEPDIKAAIDKHYANLNTHEQAQSLVKELSSPSGSPSTTPATGSGGQVSVGRSPQSVTKLVNLLLNNAIGDKATDIHIEPGEDKVTIRYRVNGSLKQALVPPKSIHEDLISRIKQLANLNRAQSKAPQEGKMNFKSGTLHVDIRVTILPTIFGEKAVLSIMEKGPSLTPFQDLGLSAVECDIFNKYLQVPYGMVLITGPSGSGTTTTMYALIQEIIKESLNITIVEESIKIPLEGITQVEVSPSDGLTYPAALNIIARQDPDAIFIGGIKDSETADIAIKLSLTGNMVFGSILAPDAASAIKQLLDIGISPMLAGSAVNLVASQRLLKRICPNCKKAYTPADSLFESLNMKGEHPELLYKGQGCDECNGSGFKGFIGAFEVMPISASVRKLILKNASVQELKDQAVKDGLRPLIQSAFDHARKGRTTIEQVLALVD